MDKTGVDKQRMKPGPKPKPEEELCRLGRFMVNIPPVRIPQLKRAAKAQGLPISAFIRQLVFNRLDDLDKAA